MKDTDSSQTMPDRRRSSVSSLQALLHTKQSIRCKYSPFQSSLGFCVAQHTGHSHTFHGSRLLFCFVSSFGTSDVSHFLWPANAEQFNFKLTHLNLKTAGPAPWHKDFSQLL
jgi:hypothetical protein